jgi:Polyketide cyclase / dehydrase and lipid transport
MSIDVTAETTIDADPQAIWDYMTDPAHEPEWIKGIRTSRLESGAALGQGSRVERIASFLGRRIHYVNEVTTYDPPRTLDMRSVVAPFPMRITYTIDGSTVRNRVRGGGIRLMAPIVRRNIQRDLDRLKAILERALT